MPLTPEQEAARRPNGEFGSHENTGPEVHLADDALAVLSGEVVDR